MAQLLGWQWRSWLTRSTLHKTLEALWIALKNPTINGKKGQTERVTVSQELAPFASVGFSP